MKLLKNKKYIYVPGILILIFIFSIIDVNIKKTFSFKNILKSFNPTGINIEEYEPDKIYQNGMVVGDNVFVKEITENEIIFFGISNVKSIDDKKYIIYKKYRLDCNFKERNLIIMFSNNIFNVNHGYTFIKCNILK